MLNNKKDDIFLSRWITGELSPEELTEFESHPEYEYYKKIMIGSDMLELSAEYDVDTALSKIKQVKNTSAQHSKPILRLWPYATAAASIAIILGIFFFNLDQSYTTHYGELVTVILPDGSEMILNAKSEASYNKKKWETNRTVSLQGEAYFKVKKGSKFTVSTKNGDVTVLGTEFNVQSYDTFFEAICYEGKVRVTHSNDQEILTAGKAYRNIHNMPSEKWTSDELKPSWVDKVSSFRSTPIKYVFNELEEQYNIKIKIDHIDTSTIYTGTFPNNDKEIALRTVFSTLGMQYKILQDNTTVVVEK